MKKFLTMLLALSVVFTYTVGTAFAVAAPVDDTKTTSYNELLKDLNDAKDATVKGLDADIKSGTIGTKDIGAEPKVEITKAAYETVANMVYADYAKVLLIALHNAEATDKATLKAYKVTAKDDARLDGKSAADVLDADGFKEFVYATKAGYEGELLNIALPAEKEKALAELAKVDLSLYSDEVMPAADYKAFLTRTDNNLDKVTYAQAANMKLEALKKAVNDTVLTDADKADVAGKAVPKFTAVRATYGAANLTAEKTETYNDIISGKPVTNVLSYSLADLDQKSKLDGDKATLEAKKLAKKAEAQANAATYIVANPDKTAEKDAYLEVVNFIIDSQTTSDIDGYAVPAVGDWSGYITKVNTYNEQVAVAAAKKLEKNLNGSLAYDAEAIDARLAEMKADIYTAGSTAKNFNDCLATEDDLAYEIKVLAAKVEAEKEKELDGDNYYELEKAQVVAIYDKIIADINNVTDKDHKDIVKAKYFVGDDVKAIAALTTAVPAKKSVIDSKVQSLPAYATEKAAVEYYVKDVVNSGLQPWDDNYRDTTAAINDLYKFYAEKGARTDAEVKALRQEAMAMVAALPTAAEKAKMKADAEALVKAIPARLALDNKAQIVAAYEAAEAAKEAGVAISADAQGILTRAIAEIKKIETKAVADQKAALPLAKVTAADKEAAKALIAAMKAFDETKMYAVTTADTDIAKYEAKIQANDKAAVEALFANLSKDSSKAEVEAARAAYDAYVAEYTDYTGADVRTVPGLDKLLTVEALVKSNDIKAVESLKIKASSKAKKGSITVKWTVKGDAEAADGYQVFRSTKKSSGFGTKPYFTTKKTTYKNTKELKKGKRYYYKVRAYKVVDGKKYYSDWSTKAYRVAK